MKRRLFIITLVLFLLNGNLFAQGTDTDEMEPTYIYRDLRLYSCINLVDLKGSRQVVEYEFPHDSITLDGKIRLINLPQRMHFDLSIKNQKDYYGDLSYAYKDILLFRGRNNTMYHNLENIKLIDLDVSTSSPGVAIKDASKDYGIKTGLSNFLLRLKTPDFPFHLYVDGTLIKKDGTQQQRFMGGAAYFNEQVRASRSRNIDWTTENIVIGTNSHLGPIEIEFSHGEKRFYAKGDDILYDSYSGSGFGTVFRKPGIYPHNLIPDQKGSSNIFKIHTSYTGRLVASATFSKVERENLYSDARADYFRGYGEVTWMPVERLAFFLNYQYMDRDIDNPDTVTISDLSDPSNTYTYDVRPSVSSISKKFSGTARYRAFKGLTLRIKFSHDNILRKDAEEWALPQKTVANTISIIADLRLRKNLKLKTNYIHKSIDNPSTNIEPDSSDEGRVSVTWTPLHWINTFLSYSLKVGEREGLHFLDTEDADNRHVRQHRFLGSVTMLPFKDLSFTVSYFYLSDSITQDIEYHDPVGIPHIDTFVPYKNNAHNYAADIRYIPFEKIELNVGVNHTRSKGRFHPDDINLTEPVSIASFSELKNKGAVYYIFGEYALGKALSLGFQYRYSRIDDMLDNPHDDVEDGRAHILLLTFSKEW